MTDTISGAPAPMWLRIVAFLGLIWNCLGVFAYLKTVGVVPGAPADMAEMVAFLRGAEGRNVTSSQRDHALPCIHFLRSGVSARRSSAGPMELPARKP